MATNSYLAGGGGGMPTLWEAQAREPLGVMIRDALIDALRGYGRAEGSTTPGSLPIPALGRIRERR